MVILIWVYLCVEYGVIVTKNKLLYIFDIYNVIYDKFYVCKNI